MSTSQKFYRTKDVEAACEIPAGSTAHANSRRPAHVDEESPFRRSAPICALFLCYGVSARTWVAL